MNVTYLEDSVDSSDSPDMSQRQIQEHFLYNLKWQIVHFFLFFFFQSSECMQTVVDMMDDKGLSQTIDTPSEEPQEDDENRSFYELLTLS
jgi:hypothetical protein